VRSFDFRGGAGMGQQFEGGFRFSLQLLQLSFWGLIGSLSS